MKFKIQATQADAPNVNGHIYPIKELEKTVKLINESEDYIIELTTDTNVDGIMPLNLHRACGKVIKGSAKIENNSLVYVVETWDTPCGKIFESAPNLTVGCITLGTLGEDKKIKHEGINKFHTIYADESNFVPKEKIE